MRALRQRLYVPLVCATGALLASSGYALLILMLANVIGPFRFDGLDGRASKNALGLFVPERATAARAAETARRVAAWRAWIRPPQTLWESSRLAAFEAADVRVVILPDARDLSERQLQLLRGFIERGGSVIASGSVAVRNPDGSWRGHASMRRFLDTPVVAPLPRERPAALQASHRGPLTVALEPVQTIALRTEAGLPAIENPDSELRWSKTGEGPDGASRRLEIGLGRLVWLAAGPEHALAADERQRLLLAQTLRAALAWARREPQLELLAWPRGALFAAVLEPTSGDRRGATPPGTREKRWRQAIESARRSARFIALELPLARSGQSRSGGLGAQALHALRSAGAWLTTSVEYRNWLDTRSRISLSYQRVGPRRLLVNVTNGAELAARDVTLRLWLNRSIDTLAVESTEVLQARPDLRFHAGAEHADLLLPALAAGASQTYHVTYGPS